MRLIVFAVLAVLGIRPSVETEPVPHDVDDPAIWVHPTDRARSLIVGTVKRPKPDGGQTLCPSSVVKLRSSNGYVCVNGVEVK